MEQETQRNTFGKSHKLYGDIPLEALFTKGQGFTRFPLRVVYQKTERRAGEYPCRMMVSVGKKRFKRAVKRNRVKRLVREAFRLNRHQLEETLATLGPEVALHIGYVFVGKELPDYPTIENAVRMSIEKMTKAITKQ